MVSCSKDQLMEKIHSFSKLGDTGHGGITRLSLSKEAIAARKEFCRRCTALGMEIKTDDMANIYAVLPGKENLPAIALGSHVDSVVKGGNYDGILGVLVSLEVAETIVRENIRLRHPLVLIVWTNEEGSRFPPAMMASGVLAGKFERDVMVAVRDAEGITFQEALKASGYLGDPSNRLNSRDYRCFIELHIEQGPILESEKKDIGVVEGVIGMVNYQIQTMGQANHAGTTPMKVRRDALFAAARIIQHLHDELNQLDPLLVYTTGQIFASPNIHTVIPDDVRFTLDARHQDPAVIRQVVDIIHQIPESVEECSVKINEQWARQTIHFSPDLVDVVAASTQQLGYPHRRMYSGAGHDAQYIAEIIPTAMIFVPSENGYSHCEKEYTPDEQCIKGANVLLQSVLSLDHSSTSPS